MEDRRGIAMIEPWHAETKRGSHSEERAGGADAGTGATCYQRLTCEKRASEGVLHSLAARGPIQLSQKRPESMFVEKRNGEMEQKGRSLHGDQHCGEDDSSCRIAIGESGAGDWTTSGRTLHGPRDQACCLPQ
jgi:hypothetical protein